MKRILRWALVALVLLVVAVLALPFLLPTSVYKEQIIEQTRLATGRELKIEGDLRLSFWPALGVQVDKVRFANVAGAAEPDMATMDSLVVGAELWPLIGGVLKVTEVRLVNPVINLEIDKQGRGNWLFEPVAGPPAADQPAAAPPSATTSSADFSFRDVTLSGGVLTYRDQREGTSQRVEAIDANVKLPSLDQPLEFNGGLTWNKEAITVVSTIANPRALSTGGKSALSSKVGGKVLSATFEGEMDAAAGAIKGTVDFSTESARRLAAWAGVALPKVKGFGPMRLKGELESSASKIAFRKATLMLDGMNGSGNLALDTGRAKPYVKGDFTLDRLDLNAYTSSGGGRRRGRRAFGVERCADRLFGARPSRRRLRLCGEQAFGRRFADRAQRAWHRACRRAHARELEAASALRRQRIGCHHVERCGRRAAIRDRRHGFGRTGGAVSDRPCGVHAS